MPRAAAFAESWSRPSTSRRRSSTSTAAPRCPHIIDGRSLRPLLFGETPADWRRHVVSEYDYSFQDARIELGTKARDAWLRMIFDGRYKYILAEGYRPMLYDLESDPHEFVDRGADPALEDVRARLHEALFQWARQPRQRATVPDRLMETTPVQQRITQIGRADRLLGRGRADRGARSRSGRCSQRTIRWCARRSTS